MFRKYFPCLSYVGVVKNAIDTVKNIANCEHDIDPNTFEAFVKKLEEALSVFEED